MMIDDDDYNNLSSVYLSGGSFQWTQTVMHYRQPNAAIGGPQSDYDLVIGPLATKKGGQWVPVKDSPDQYVFKGTSTKYLRFNRTVYTLTRIQMEPDLDALDGFRKAWTNLLRDCPGWSEEQIARWIELKVGDWSRSLFFYNNPPALVLTAAFLPEESQSKFSPSVYQELRKKIYEALESEGHWNDFSDPHQRAAVLRRVQAILAEFRDKCGA
jgi:hypothetical protein